MVDMMIKSVLFHLLLLKMKQIQQRVWEIIFYSLWVLSWISFVCLFSAVATDNSIWEIKQMLSECNKPQLAVDIVDDLVDRRITKAEQDWWWEWSNFLNRLSSNIYYDWDDYDTVMEQCVDIIKNTH